MEWVQVLTIIVTLLGGIFYIHSDVRDIKKDMQQHNARMDQLSNRIDKLYEMFIDLLKSKNTP
jgi:hypothetical protein